MAKALITLNDIAARRGEDIVFPGTNWVLHAGDAWAVTGPNGSGKSTFAHILTGSLPVVRGEIVYHFLADPDAVPSRHDVIHLSLESQRELVDGSSPFYQFRWNSLGDDEGVTVDEFLSAKNIYALSSFHVLGRDDIPKSFARQRRLAIRRMEIASLLRRRIAELSNGETRKVLLARALMQHPKLLILDDPFAGLDRHSRAHLKEVIRDLVREKHTIILIVPDARDIPPGISKIMRLGRPARTAQRSSLRLPRSTGRSPAPEILVNLRGARVRYGRTEILRGIDWTIRRGEKWALVGPNGSGKTTLIGLIMGDHPQAYANDLTLFGKPRGTGESIWDIKDRIGWVSPELQFHFPDDATAVDAVRSGFFHSIGLFHSCTRTQAARADAWMRALGLFETRHKRVGELLPGERRLVFIARALVKSPWLLIFDEPCQGLDKENRRRVVSVIDQVGRRTAAAMICVAHRDGEIPPCVNRVLRLR